MIDGDASVHYYEKMDAQVLEVVVLRWSGAEAAASSRHTMRKYRSAYEVLENPYFDVEMADDNHLKHEGGAHSDVVRGESHGLIDVFEAAHYAIGWAPYCHEENDCRSCG